MILAMDTHSFDSYDMLTTQTLKYTTKTADVMWCHRIAMWEFFLPLPLDITERENVTLLVKELNHETCNINLWIILQKPWYLYLYNETTLSLPNAMFSIEMLWWLFATWRDFSGKWSAFGRNGRMEQSVR